MEREKERWETGRFFCNVTEKNKKQKKGKETEKWKEEEREKRGSRRGRDKIYMY